MKKIIVSAVLGVAVSAVVVMSLYKQDFDRIAFVGTLFSGAEQYENFNRVKDLIPVTTMTAAKAPFEFASGEQISMPESFGYEGNSVSVEEFLDSTVIQMLFP